MDFINQSGIGNIILSVSNITGILPILTTFYANDITTCLTIVFVMVASMGSHLCQTGYNGLWGFGASMDTFFIGNFFDIIGCWLVVARIGFLYLSVYGISIYGFTKDPVLLFSSAVALLLNVISCWDRSDTKYFVIIHSLWHCAVFVYLNAWLCQFYSDNDKTQWSCSKK